MRGPSFERLERRRTSYRFDLSRDVPWSRLDEPGLFAGPHLLRALGITGGGDELQWAFGLATAEGFVALEKDVTRFVSTHAEARRSAKLLVEEEQKHTEMFARVAAHLRAARPELVADFDATWRAPVSFEDLVRGAQVANDDELHHLIWLATLFFEEYTVWIHHALEVDGAAIQPAWREVHALHQREEAQHVLTDAAFLASLPLGEAARRRLSRAFQLFLESDLDSLLCLDALDAFASRRGLRALAPERRLTSLPFLRELLHHRAFEQTRRAMPALALLDHATQLAPVESLADALSRAAEGPRGVVLVAPDGSEERWTYAELRSRALRTLAGLEARGLGEGDLVLLVAPAPKDFLPVFWACVLGGLVPAPLGPPTSLAEADVEIDRLLAIHRELGASAVVSDAVFAPALRRFANDRGVALEVIEASELAGGLEAEPRPGEVAFLQLSSGSTRAPHAVRLTHGNVLASARAMLAHRDGGVDDVFVSWLPLFHDMGLAGYHLTPLVAGAEQVLMTPAQFARNPLSLLRAIHTHRGTATGCPGSALARLVKRASRGGLDGLDLSSLRCWLIGAEPLSIQVLEEASRLLGGARMKEDVLCPGYGLAEATLAVTMTPLGERPRAWPVDPDSIGKVGCNVRAGAGTHGAIALVDCGTPISAVTLRLTGERGEEVGEGVVGNIEVRGAAVASAEGAWVATGDLGVLRGGRLFVTGRVRETFFSGGRTLHAHDLEAVALELPEVRPEGAALVVHPADEGGVERLTLCIAPTPKRAPEEVMRAVARHVAARMGVRVDEVVTIARASLPRTSSGKLQRFRLGELLREGRFAHHPRWTPVAARAEPAGGRAEETIALVRRIWAEALDLTADDLDPDADFHELGGTSILAADIHGRLEQALGQHFGHELLVHGKTVRTMAAFLDGLEAPAPVAAPAAAVSWRAPDVAPALPRDAVAVVGLALRLPGADGPRAFWRVLREGGVTISDVPPERFDAGALLAELGGRVTALRGAFLDDVTRFDPEPFGLSDEVATAMDPQQRLFLEVALDALGQALVPGDRAGVFVACGDNEYALRYLGAPELAGRHALLGALHSMVAARVASVLGLTGPAMTVDTACSASLTAVHLAARSIRDGECDVALAGGVQVNLTDQVWRYFAGAGLLAPDGECRPFDRAASGLVPGEGAVCLLLKPLAAAVRDRDRVWGVLRGTAMNNDGGALSGTAPNPRGQREVMSRAWATAGLSPATASYVEAHAAGTAIGDAIEVSSLAEVFAGAAGLPVGSVKASFGHTFAASGALGLAKVLVALREEALPPNASCPNPAERIRFGDTSLEPCLEVRPWPRGDVPRRAGVDSFGLGGTNVHVVVEAHDAPLAPEGEGPVVYPLAATTERLAAVASSHRAVAGTLASRTAAAIRRARWGRARAALVVSTTAELDAALEALPLPGARASRVALLLPGPGSQRAQMGAALAAREPAFAEAWAECRDELHVHGVDLAQSVVEEHVDRIDAAQAAAFAFGYASWRWLSRLGLSPHAVIGHSGGELLAAHIGSVLTFEDAVALVVARGRAMLAAPEGASAVVFAAEHAVRAALPAGVTIAAVNAPAQTVVSGTRDALEALVARLAAEGTAARVLPVNTPAHSAAMTPVAEVFLGALAEIEQRAPSLPWISSRTAAVMGRPSPDYWARQLVEPVRFADALGVALDAGVDLFLELGATAGLTACAEAVSAGRATCVALGKRDEPEHQAALSGVAAVWSAGIDLRLDLIEGARAAPAELPCWPWERRRLWIDARRKPAGLAISGDAASVADHVISGTPTAPASLLLDHLLQHAGGGLARVVVRAPLAIARGERVPVSIESGADGLSLSARGVVHVTAAAAPSPPRTFDRLDVASVRARCPRPVAVEEVHGLLSASGFVAGPRMRALRSVQVGEGELIAELVTPPGGDRGVAIDPAILDGASQAVAALFVGRGASSRPFLGFSIGALSVWRPVRGAALAVVQLRSPIGDALRYDVLLADAEGRLLAEARDFGAKRAASEVATAPVRAAAPVLAVAASAPDDLEGWLVAELARRVRRAPSSIALDDPLARLGLDSMKAVDLVAKLEAKLGVSLPATFLFEARTLRDVLARLRAR